MKLRSFRYLLGEGLKNTWANRLMTLASIGVLVACMVIIGLAILIAENVNLALGNLEEQNVVMAFMKDKNWAMYSDELDLDDLKTEDTDKEDENENEETSNPEEIEIPPHPFGPSAARHLCRRQKHLPPIIISHHEAPLSAPIFRPSCKKQTEEISSVCSLFRLFRPLRHACRFHHIVKQHAD